MQNQNPPSAAPGARQLVIRPLGGRPGLALIGQADIGSVDTLHAALAALTVDGAREVHLDVSRLGFIDVACTRELAVFTDRHPAVHLIAHRPPASLRRIATLAYPEARLELCDRPVPAAGADVIDLITRDHARITQLFARLDELAGGHQNPPGSASNHLGQTWTLLARLLHLQMDAEEEICYPAMAATGLQAARVRAAAADHWDIREALAEARLSPVGSSRWWRAVTDSRRVCTRHFREEDNLLVSYHGQSSPEARNVLGRQWIAFMLAGLRDDSVLAELHNDI